MQRMNAAKNLLSLLVNIVAAVAYTRRRVRPDQLGGGRTDRGRLAASAGSLGAHYGRRLSPNALRVGDRGGGRDRAVSAGHRLVRA